MFTKVPGEVYTRLPLLCHDTNICEPFQVSRNELCAASVRRGILLHTCLRLTRVPHARYVIHEIVIASTQVKHYLIDKYIDKMRRVLACYKVIP